MYIRALDHAPLKKTSDRGVEKLGLESLSQLHSLKTRVASNMSNCPRVVAGSTVNTVITYFFKLGTLSCPEKQA